MSNTFAKTYQKAQSRVILRLVLFFLFLCIYFVGMIWFFDQPFFYKSSQIEMLYLFEIMGEAVLILLDFFVVAAGRSYSRGFLWILVVLECLLPLLPMYLFFYERAYLLLEFAWFLLLSLKAYCFYLLAQWMSRNEWASFYFKSGKESSRTPRESLRQSLEQEAVQYQKSRQALQEQAYQDQEYEDEYEYEDEPPVRTISEVRIRKLPNYSQLAVRLGVMIYGQLVFFPILIQVFQDFFLSVDGRSFFAGRWMFNDCLCSALLWTLSLFFLFLNMKSARKVVTLTFGLQAIATIYFLYNLYTVYTGIIGYPVMVYVYLIVIDLIRLVLITWIILPVYRTPIPKRSLFSEEAYQEEDEYDEED